MINLCILEAKDDYLSVDYVESDMIEEVTHGHAIFDTNFSDENSSMTNYIYSIEDRLEIFKNDISISTVRNGILYYEFPSHLYENIIQHKKLIIKLPSRKELAKFKLRYY